MAKNKIIFIIIIILIILIVLFLPGYAKLQDLITENKRLEKRIGELEISIQKLDMEKERLESDITYVEKMARETMGLMKEGEKKIEREK